MNFRYYESPDKRVCSEERIKVMKNKQDKHKVYLDGYTPPHDKSTRYWTIGVIIFLLVSSVLLNECSASESTETWLHTGGTSYHTQRVNSDGEAWNEDNTGVGIEQVMENSRWRWMAGAYKDSYYTTTKYAGAVYSKPQGKYLNLNYIISAVQSPHYNKGNMFLLVWPSIEVQPLPILRVSVTALPSVFTQGNGSVVAVQYKVRLW